MINEQVQIIKHRRNATATRIISAVLCIEQAVYGYFFALKGSELQKVYFISSIVIALLFLSTYLLPLLYKRETGVFMTIAEMIPLTIGMAIAYTRMLHTSDQFRSIPTIYIAILFGGAVVFLLSYWQSAVLYGLFIIMSILGVESGFDTDPTVPFKADFLVNGIIAWSVSAINYRGFVREQEQKRLIEAQNIQLSTLSERDGLTGLYNRRKLDQSLQKAMLSHPDPCPYTSLILFDLDNFKNVNDTYGHQRGDLVLKELASLITEELQEGELFGRWGGEEFLILSNRDGEQLSEHLRKKIESTTIASVDTITASFGVAVIAFYPSAQLLIMATDKALYKAKDLGRNRVVVASPIPNTF